MVLTEGRWDDGRRSIKMSAYVLLCHPLAAVSSLTDQRYVSVRGSDLYNLFSDQLIFIRTLIFTRPLNEPLNNEPDQTNNVFYQPVPRRRPPGPVDRSQRGSAEGSSGSRERPPGLGE